jgi:hypothetical protein
MKEKEKTILGCMSGIIEDIRDTEKKFNEKIFEEKAEEIEYISAMCGTTPWQSVLLSCIIERSNRNRLDKSDLARFMGMSYIKLLAFDTDLASLHKMRLIVVYSDSYIHLPSHVLSSLSKNQPYSIPDNYNLDTPELMKRLRDLLKQRMEDELDEWDMVERLDELMTNNQECSFVKAAAKYRIFIDGNLDLCQQEKVVFYNLVYRYLYEDDDQVGWHDFNDVFQDSSDINVMRSRYRREGLLLQLRGIIEPVGEDGFFNIDLFHIKDEIKEELFEDVGGLRKRTTRKTRMKLIPSKDIKPRDLFYNPGEAEQVNRLASLLADATYRSTCERLKESGLRTGFSCIFYGSPGTGKTETVYQLARQTGRALVPINVSEIKSCWVGESEKLIKNVFDKYRKLVQESDIAPILLFNEADAIFGIRREAATDAVDKMENAIQNIILQEMEELDGILIATTNLTQNLDKAFERRFLYKIKFNKPLPDVKSKIWKSFLPGLSDEQAAELSSGFDFSGGQIENVSRKKVIQTIIEGHEPSFDEVKGYCGEELIDNNNGQRKRIGF